VRCVFYCFFLKGEEKLSTLIHHLQQAAASVGELVELIRESFKKVTGFPKKKRMTPFC